MIQTGVVGGEICAEASLRGPLVCIENFFGTESALVFGVVTVVEPVQGRDPLGGNGPVLVAQELVIPSLGNLLASNGDLITEAFELATFA